MNEILSDETKFKLASNQNIYKISRTIETKVRNYLRNQVYKPGYITEAVYKQLYPNGSHIGVMYGLPKVHKPGSPCRPICSAIGTPTYALGKFVSKIIKPASYNVHGTDLKNTFDFVAQMSQQNVSQQFMVSYDVCSLFTNVPLAKTIDVCMDRLYRSSLTPPELPEDVLRHLISLCVVNNTFLFNGKVYQQSDGVAMGSSLGPILANIWMCHLEEEYYVKSQLYPNYYRRYVDDTFCLFNNRESANNFFNFINNVHPSTKFDMESENNNKLSFLDTIVHRSSSMPFTETSTKVKATDKGLFYAYNSFVPTFYKLSLMKGLIFRVFSIASSYSWFHSDLIHLRNKFISNGFPKHLVDLCTNSVLSKIYSVPSPVIHTVKKKSVIFVLPFLGPLSYLMSRKLKKLIHKFYPYIELKVVFKRGFCIGDLFKFKDKMPLECRSGVLYYTKCKKCGPSVAYLGKTKNTTYERFFSSNGHLNPGTKHSPLHQHISETGDPECEFVFKDIEILGSCSDDLQLRYMESIMLKIGRKQSLNTQDLSIPLQIF